MTTVTADPVVDSYKTEVIDPGDRASALAKELCFQTHQACPAVYAIPRQRNNFRGGVDWRWCDHILEAMLRKEVVESVENDGAGGKPQFFTLLGTEPAFHHLGREVVEMCVEDLVRSGRFPAIFLNQVDVKQVTDQNIHLVKAMFEGFAEALREVNLINITGEFAIMKHTITAFCDTGSSDQLILSWCGACIGLSRPDRYLDGRAIKPGMPIVGLWEPGYRCNGGTALTKILLHQFGSDFKAIQGNPEALKFLQALTIPSKSYAKTLLRLQGWQLDGTVTAPAARIVGIAHITGGGVWSKLGDLLPEGVGAELTNMPDPAWVLRQAQEYSWDVPELRITDWQAHGTFHGGCGMIVVCADETSASTVIARSNLDRIQAQLIGNTVESADSEIKILPSHFKEGRNLSSLDTC